jgi:hypothetical protein
MIAQAHLQRRLIVPALWWRAEKRLLLITRIEAAFRQLLLRRPAARTTAGLLAAIADARVHSGDADAHSFFDHCAYVVAMCCIQHSRPLL